MKESKIIVYHLDTGDVETFCSMAALLKQYPSMSEIQTENTQTEI